jgi:PAS domain S-box-containing protein
MSSDGITDVAVNILLVDDRSDNLLALEAILGDMGHTLIRANSGEEALKQILKYDFAAILLDVQMPNMNGFETARLIKSRERSKHIPVIFITAINRSEEHVYQGYSMGAVDYLFKPVIPEVLRAKVKTFVDLFINNKILERQSQEIAVANQRLERQLAEVRRLSAELGRMNISLHNEVMERQSIESALQKSEKMYRTLAQNLPNTVVFLFDSEFRYLLVEGELMQRWGKPWFVEGGMLWETTPSEPANWFALLYQQAFAGEGSVAELQREGCTFSVHVLPVYNEKDEVFAGIGMIQDISERKAIEEALSRANAELELRVQERTQKLNEANQELRTFTYIVSHDLRAPLVNLKGFVSELTNSIATVCSETEAIVPEHQQSDVLIAALHRDIPEAIEFINAAVARMDGLTGAILRLSRLGYRELMMETLPMNALIRTIVNSFAHQIEEQRVQIEIEPLPDVTADRVAMEQIFGNILSNAINYLSPDRQGKIRISADTDDGVVTFHVADNGVGIRTEDNSKVFEPFRRAGKHTVPGEGMGLAYVQVLVRRHGGSIWFTSQVNVGTTFSFTIHTDAVVQSVAVSNGLSGGLSNSL